MHCADLRKRTSLTSGTALGGRCKNHANRGRHSLSIRQDDHPTRAARRECGPVHGGRLVLPPGGACPSLWSRGCGTLGRPWPHRGLAYRRRLLVRISPRTHRGAMPNGRWRGNVLGTASSPLVRMDDGSLPHWWPYPQQCEHGHPWGPGRVIVAWRRCWCRGPGEGHTIVACRVPGCPCVSCIPAHVPEEDDDAEAVSPQDPA
jgi:hypothetical protein